MQFPGNSLSEELVDDVHAFEGSYQAGPSEHSGKMHVLVDDLSGISDARFFCYPFVLNLIYYAREKLYPMHNYVN